ncbi:reverse transcriptase domain-containing protein, partial [Tanacetum coccineum]
AEYEALIADLRIAEQMGVKNLQANVDSRLVANQVNGFYTAKESGNKVKTLAKSFKEFSIKQIPRSENKKPDALSKIASTSFVHLNKQVLVEELKEKSINEKEILDVVEEEVEKLKESLNILQATRTQRHNRPALLNIFRLTCASVILMIPVTQLLITPALKVPVRSCLNNQN